VKSVLVIKCGAAGDVVRTTPLISLFREWQIEWLTAPENRDLVPTRYVPAIFDSASQIPDGKSYDLVISLEDDIQLLRAVGSRIRAGRVFGSYEDGDKVTYTSDSAEWFDLSLVSRWGVKEADRRKLKNRQSYQEIIFRGLDHEFKGEPYLLPDDLPPSSLRGHVCVAPRAGTRWPAKNWRHMDRLIDQLANTYTVNILPPRDSIRQHIADIRGHSFLISGDSLPMHIALGLGIPCLAFFTCTSPWEIFDYGLLSKVISPQLEKYFYTRDHSEEASAAIEYDGVWERVNSLLHKHIEAP
jgi:heptosyltransferase II